MTEPVPTLFGSDMLADPYARYAGDPRAGQLE